MSGEVVLRPHRIRLALLQPQIAPNTGNIARLCVASGTELHLVRPMGFVLSDRELRRSAMDYCDRLKLTLHDDTEAFFRAIGQDQRWLFSSRGDRNYWDVKFEDGDWLVFGSETAGIPETLLRTHEQRIMRIPQAKGERA